MNAEIVSLSLGQAGIQISNAVWELFCLEHGIAADGVMLTDPKINDIDNRHHVFYYPSSDDQMVPRSVMADLEPTVIDEIRSGAFRNLHHPDCLINGFEDAANNYARGHFTMGKALLDTTLENIRRQTNRCESLQGFFMTTGGGGGTGSGFGSLLLERLSIEYGKCSKVLVNLFPGPQMSTAVVEPYNVALAMHSGIEHTDVNITLDNQACYLVCQNNLNMLRPTYTNVNRLMAQVTSAMTCSLRFASTLNADLAQLQTNLVPYPRIHFPVVSYAPIVCQSAADRDKLTSFHLIRDVFESSGRLISCDTTKGKFMACNLQFRGLLSPMEMSKAVLQIKKTTAEFVDWCPTGFKVGHSVHPPLAVPGSVLASTNMNLTMLANSTSVTEIWQFLVNRFLVMYKKKAFVHWYIGEGMEESEFDDALEDISNIMDDYNEVGKDTEVEQDDADEVQSAEEKMERAPSQDVESQRDEEPEKTEDENESKGGDDEETEDIEED